MNHWINCHESKKLRLWCIDDGEQWWYSAVSKEEALEMHTEEMLEGDIDEAEVLVHEVSSDTIIVVTNEDGIDVKNPASKWASDGKGLVASTLF